MAKEDASRRLATIVAADVAGYTRLVGQDEEGSLATLKSHRSELVDPKISRYRGRIANTAGDSIIAEFPSVREALDCAIDIQRGLAERNVDIPEGRRIRFRIGINLGDVFEQDGDLLGDGVNIAARLEAIAPPGAICVSEAVKNSMVPDAVVQFKDIGPQRLKNVSKSVHAYLVAATDSDASEARSEYSLSNQSRTRFVLSEDGVSIAYADIGNGYPLVFGASWMTHLEKDWENPSWGHYISHLAKDFTVIRYDQRGNGMSDWDGVDISFEKMVDDLERVIDCYDHEKVALFGASQAASVAIAYLMRHPEKVSHLILHGGYARGRRRRGDPKAESESEALVTLIRQGWGADNPAFRQTMTSLFMPDANQEEAVWFNDFQKACGPAENIAQFRETFDEMDVSDLLGNVRVPTLVIHCSGDSVAPISEGKFLASRIQEAQFVMLNSNNHMMFENEPEFPELIHSIREFIR